MQDIQISIVSPVYKAQEFVIELVSQLELVLSKITAQYEIILVEDCGNDASWQLISEICQTNKRVVGVRLSRNFGQHYAITAGLDLSKGEWVVVMDCDLQDRPDQIPLLYKKAMEGFEIVQGRRVDRKDSKIKIAFSWLFYKGLAYLSGYNMDSTIANFGIYNRKVINAIISMKENVKFFPTMVSWVGFKRTSIPIEHSARVAGSSSYNFNKLFKLAVDIILSNSERPLKIMIKVGIAISISSFVFLIYNLLKYLLGQITVMGYASLISSMWFLSGILMLMLGIVGLYVGKTFESTKGRPIYIIDVIVNGRK